MTLSLDSLLPSPLDDQERISVAAASKLLANTMYNYRGYGLSMGTCTATSVSVLSRYVCVSLSLCHHYHCHTNLTHTLRTPLHSRQALW